MASKKLRKLSSGDGDELDVDMSPMIDMVFLLLIFFIVSSNLIIVQNDPKVEVPEAVDAQKVEEIKGRIVINIYEDGTLKNETGSLVFAEESDLGDYIKGQKDIIKGQGLEPMLHLRGDRRAVFKHCRKVMRAAAGAELFDFRFASFGTKNHYKN